MNLLPPLAAVPLLLLAAPRAAGQGMAPEKCTVCRNDPKLLARNGVSHGPFVFGRNDTGTIEKDYFWHPVWIETKHFRIGADLRPWKVPEAERKAYRAELTELAKKWPRIKPKKTLLDPWLRVHLMAGRLEDFYQEFLDLMGMDEEKTFLEEDWRKPLGLGPYLGEFDKYEVMLFQETGVYRDFMSRAWGLSYETPQRWNNIDRNCMWFGLSIKREEIHHDMELYNNVLHSVSMNMLDGFYFYAYDIPVWIREGFAHWARRKNDERFDVFDTVEGSFEQERTVRRWAPEVRKLIAKDRAVSISSLLRRQSFAELGFDDHLVAWSKIDFLIREDPGKFGQFIRSLAFRRTPKGLPDSSGLDDAQRNAFRKLYGWTLPHLEEEWKQWVLKTYPKK
ncbi:MAG: hypothetical protein ACE5H3_00040 [Planctomycetota bacterium]